MTKIKSISIKGLRGIKEQLTLEPNQKSVLLFGENGSGKSSITDVIEWFYNNRIDHLSGEEIGRGGLEALKNIFLNDNTDAVADLEFTDEKLNSQKTIYYKAGSLHSEFSNPEPIFKEYVDMSRKENLILRHQDLLKFILFSKKDKLDNLSEIIGFSEVSKVRDILGKAVNEVKREYKKGNYDHQVSTQQPKIIESLGRTVNTDDQFVEAVNELVKPLNIGIKIERIDEIGSLLLQLKKPEDRLFIELQSFYHKTFDWASNLLPVLEIIEDLFKKYTDQFQKIISDVEKINKILLENLLTEGVKLINTNAYTIDECPLCLHPKPLSELLKELETRIIELQSFKKEKLKLNELKGSLNKELREASNKVHLLLSDKNTNTEENRELKDRIERFKTGLEIYAAQLNLELLSGQQLKACETIRIDRENINRAAAFCRQKFEAMREATKDNPRIDIHGRILLSREAYNNIKKLKKESEIVLHQQNSLEAIYSEFLKKQKESLESFLTFFSNDINELYQFMNPDEKVENIRLVPIEKADELAGITLEYNFFKNAESPPHKYLSESHLNCLGIAFFLTSVKAFNKSNKFFILDDVISSFDTTHRKRFADLLIGKFSDYQVILLTHEPNFFEIMRNLAKRNQWIINTLKWSKQIGTYLAKEPINLLKHKIESKLEANDEDGLANDIRQYIEQTLKDIAYKLKVRVTFMYNDKNEDRMANELLTDLRHHLKKEKALGLNDNPIIERLQSSSLFIGNKGSHSSLFKPGIGDLIATWKDVNEFEALFSSNKCPV
ncbi:MAG: hypothetical protein NT166_06900 [Candidatus Aminicenantes bacterium]|nr:hypothetical protein [Candidatus Aminicenantes bacterium]